MGQSLKLRACHEKSVTVVVWFDRQEDSILEALKSIVGTSSVLTSLRLARGQEDKILTRNTWTSRHSRLWRSDTRHKRRVKSRDVGGPRQIQSHIHSIPCEYLDLV